MNITTMLLCVGILLVGLTTADVPVPVDPATLDPTGCLEDYQYKILQGLMTCENKQSKIARLAQEQENAIRFMTKKLKALFDWYKSGPGIGGGATYTRWGRTTCPEHAKLVYAGIVGGSNYAHHGGASNPLCLPTNPDWSYYDNKVDTHSGYVYGTEYELGGQGDYNAFFRKRTQPQTPLKQRDATCAVCCAKRPKVLMIPSKTQCPTGWTVEYKGYLMAGHHAQGTASKYVCVDDAPEATSGGEQNQNGYGWYLVEARCGSLKCPPYVQGRELTCVVCSK